MPLDTRIDGDPDAVRAVAHWLRDGLAAPVAGAVDALHRSRTAAEAGWEGAAGDGFRAAAARSADRADTLHRAIVDCARAVDGTADALALARDEMGRVRAAAAAAGLTVLGETIEDPAPGSERALAYESARRVVDATLLGWTMAGRTLVNVWSELCEKWFFVVADLVTAEAGVVGARRASALAVHADRMREASAAHLELARRAPAGTPAALVYRDVDASRVLARRADDVAEAAARLDSRLRSTGFRVGGALAAGSLAYDLYRGKDPEQAIVSGAAGFGTSLLAGIGGGAAVGSALPVAGTAVGAVAGVVAGLFVSGAVDALYEDGTHGLGAAAGAGADAVVDAGVAVRDLAAGAWHALG